MPASSAFTLALALLTRAVRLICYAVDVKGPEDIREITSGCSTLTCAAPRFFFYSVYFYSCQTGRRARARTIRGAAYVKNVTVNCVGAGSFRTECVSKTGMIQVFIQNML